MPLIITIPITWEQKSSPCEYYNYQTKHHCFLSKNIKFETHYNPLFPFLSHVKMSSSSYQNPSSLLLSQLLYCFLFLLLLTLPVSDGRPLSEQQHSGVFNTSSMAILVFGDSTVDPGNNNFVPTVFRSNFPPYGRDFVNHQPTGRFSNGRLATDYIGKFRINQRENFKIFLFSLQCKS